jgi:CRISPR-associated protein Csx16
MYRKALIDYAETHCRDNDRVGTVSEVFADHDVSLVPGDVPPGISLDMSVSRVDSGYNGKRPLYWVENTREFISGTFFGNASSARFCSDADLEYKARELLPKETLTEINFQILSVPVIIVSRHAGAVQWLAEQGITGEVSSHVSPEQVKGKKVYGTVPLNLASMAYSVTTIVMDLAPEDRGKDLTPEEMRQRGARLETFKASRI